MAQGIRVICKKGERTQHTVRPAEEAMPTYVDPQACNACAGVDMGPLCVYICPNDLMVLRPDLGKGSNVGPGSVLRIS